MSLQTDFLFVRQHWLGTSQCPWLKKSSELNVQAQEHGISFLTGHSLQIWVGKIDTKNEER